MAESVSMEELDSLLGTSDVSAEPTLGAEGISVSEDDVNALLSMRVRDENTGEILPEKLSGIDPESAVNESVVSLADRTRMQLGNVEGNVDYLKTKFDDAAVNSAGRITVKQNDKWYYADPNIDEMDFSWQLSEEILADSVIDAIGPGMIGGASAVGMLGGGPNGAIAGAAYGEYLRSSLGRIVGTYSATPEEQTRDIALETLFEMGGQKFLPGVKPTAKKVINALDKVASKTGVKGAVQKGADVLWDFYGSLATSAEVTKTFRDNPEMVLKVMKQNGGGFSRPTQYIDNVVSGKIDDVAKLAKKAPKMLSKAYTSTRDQIVRSVPDSFQGNANMYSTAAYTEFLDKGVSRMRMGADYVTDPQQFATAMKYIKDKGRLPKGMSVEFKSQRELQQLVNSGLQVDDAFRRAAVDEDAYKALKSAHDVFAGFSGRPMIRVRGGQVLAGRGKGEAARLLDDKKSLSKILYGISDDQKLSSMGEVSGYINGLRKGMDDITVKHFDQYGMGKKFQEMNATYNQYSDLLMPLERANQSSKKLGMQAYETLMNQLASKPGKNIARKEGLDQLASLASKMGDVPATKQIKFLNQRLQAADAALALNPLVTKRAAGAGMAAYAALSANGALLGALTATAAATNTGVQQLALKTNFMTHEALKQVKSMSGREISFILDNPTAATAMLRGIQDGKQTYESTKALFESQFPAAPQRGPNE